MNVFAEKTCRVCLARNTGIVKIFGNFQNKSVSSLINSVCRVKVILIECSQICFYFRRSFTILAEQTQEPSSIDLRALSDKSSACRFNQKALREKREISFWTFHGRSSFFSSFECQAWRFRRRNWFRWWDVCRRMRTSNYADWIPGCAGTTRISSWLGTFPEDQRRVEREKQKTCNELLLHSLLQGV